jgi:transposase InsO family protein
LGRHCFDSIMRHLTMFALLLSLLSTLRAALRTRADLALEGLALRQQLANLRRTSTRPRLRRIHRAFWLAFSRLGSRWANVLVFVKPDTVVRWHRTGFRLFWPWKSRSRKPAQNAVSPEVKALIQQLAEANVGWGAPRIHGKLLKLGIDVGERSVSRFMPPRPRKPPSQTWRTFLDIEGMGIEPVLTARRSPWQNPYAERLVASIRRECLDHVIVLGSPSSLRATRRLEQAVPGNPASFAQGGPPSEARRRPDPTLLSVHPEPSRTRDRAPRASRSTSPYPCLHIG